MAFDRHLFMVIGGTGDLARRKLIPSLYGLLSEAGFAERCTVLAVGVQDHDDESYRAVARRALADAGVPAAEAGGWCAHRLHYQRIGTGPSDYGPLADRVALLEADGDLPGNRVFYLALPPAVFPVALEGLGNTGLGESAGWTRVVVEKPFGRDLASAQGLNAVAHRFFTEPQVYRIDHYLGKETVRNLLVFRFANALFERAWNRDHIEEVQITVAEDLGVESRAGYYDRSGALRDMVQNHMTQLLTLVAMEPPVTMEADAIRDEKVKVLGAIRPLGRGDAAFGRYGPGGPPGPPLAGYLDEPDIDPTSTTPTAVALRLTVDNWRWQGVPFYLRTGKRFPARRTEMVVRFRAPPVHLFDPATGARAGNVLVVTLQPDEGFRLRFDVKVPGDDFRLERRALAFRYADAFGEIPEAYRTLIRDVIEGDQTLFVRSDEVEESWRIYGGLLDGGPPPDEYPAGTWGPASFDELLARDGHRWFTGGEEER